MRYLIVSIIFLNLNSFAQKASVSDLPVSEDTVISIKKGQAAAKPEKLFEITEGTGEIAGDPQLLVKEARAAWKKACDEWRKEIKDLNKENKIIILQCNQPKCANIGTEGMVCSSAGNYKIRVPVN
jgi:hypothetical protein